MTEPKDRILVVDDERLNVEVLFHFDRADPAKVVTGARHPRNNRDWPAVGIFAQRGKGRPNRIGSTVCRIVGVTGSSLRVAELDAIDGTPVLDLKPGLYTRRCHMHLRAIVLEGANCRRRLAGLEHPGITDVAGSVAVEIGFAGVRLG